MNITLRGPHVTGDRQNPCGARRWDITSHQGLPDREEERPSSSDLFISAEDMARYSVTDVLRFPKPPALPRLRGRQLQVPVDNPGGASDLSTHEEGGGNSAASQRSRRSTPGADSARRHSAPPVAEPPLPLPPPAGRTEPVMSPAGLLPPSSPPAAVRPRRAVLRQDPEDTQSAGPSSGHAHAGLVPERGAAPSQGKMGSGASAKPLLARAGPDQAAGAGAGTLGQGRVPQPSAHQAGDHPLAGPAVGPLWQAAVAQLWDQGGANPPAGPLVGPLGLGPTVEPMRDQAGAHPLPGPAAGPLGQGPMVRPLRDQAGVHPPPGPAGGGALAPVSIGPLTVPPPAPGGGPRRNGARNRRKGGGKGAAYSQLTPDDHERYLAGFEMDKQGEEQPGFEALKARVQQDQENYVAHMKAVHDSESGRYRQYNETIQRHVEAKIRKQRARVHTLPRLWHPEAALPLKPLLAAELANPGGFPLTHSATLATSGAAPAFLQPPAGTALPLRAMIFPPEPPVDIGLQGTGAAVSEGAGKLVVAASAISALAQTLPTAHFTGTWEIPVTVTGSGERQQEATAGREDPSEGGTCMSIAIEKPLVRRRITLRDKHELLYKHAALCIGITLAATTAAPPPPDPGGGEVPRAPAVHPSLPPATLARPGAVPRKNGAASGGRSPAASAGRAETRYDLWRVGDREVVVRSRVRARRWVSAGGGEAQGRPVVVRGKAEYLGGQQGDLVEDTTLLETARRWAALTFHPGSQLVLARVRAGSPTFASFDVYEAEDMAQSFSPGFAMRLLSAVAQRVGALRPGRYLLTHETGADHVGLLRAIPEWEISERPIEDLQCNPENTFSNRSYDLWSAHAEAAEQHLPAPFIPPRWQPSDDRPQIPHTLPLRPPVPNPRKRKGPRGPGGRERVQAPPGQRQRRPLVTSWHPGALDWDSMIPKPAPKEFSAGTYQRQLEEELG